MVLGKHERILTLLPPSSHFPPPPFSSFVLESQLIFIDSNCLIWVENMEVMSNLWCEMRTYGTPTLSAMPTHGYES